MPTFAIAPAESGPDAPPDKAPERPAWLPEGFDNPEEFRAAYDKMRANLEPDQPSKPEDAPAAPNTLDQAAPNTLDQAAAKFVEQAGLDVSALSRQIAETGSLDDASRAKLEDVIAKAGLSKDDAGAAVNDYVKMKKEAFDARAGAAVKEIHDAAGGAEAFQAMGEWARTNLPPEDLKTLSDLFESGDVKQAKFAVKSLMAQYKANVRQPGKTLKATTGPVGGDVFASFAEQVAAQSDPRYASDPAFRRAVEEKIERTFRMRRR